jgi:hypothetical protein
MAINVFERNISIEQIVMDLTRKLLFLNNIMSMRKNQLIEMPAIQLGISFA